MKKIAILSFTALLFAACGGASQQTVNTNIAPNNQAQNSGNSMTVSSHSQTNSTVNSNSTVVPKSQTKTKWTQSGDPIDTSAFDEEIKKAEMNLARASQNGLRKDNSDFENAKKSLAEAFVKRGLALTEARQYASALGDYRKALKLDANNEEAKKWIDQIISIYKSINKEYPKEGEEPSPLPFKKP